MSDHLAVARFLPASRVVQRKKPRGRPRGFV